MFAGELWFVGKLFKQSEIKSKDVKMFWKYGRDVIYRDSVAYSLH